MTETHVLVDVPSAPYYVTVGAGVSDSMVGPISAATGGVDRVAIVADERVVELYGAPELKRLLTDGPERPVLQLTGGEAIKSLGTLERVLGFCAESSLSRRSALVAYGGGTIGDLTGLAASLFKRGLHVVQVPTTLLAQVDASVGGKTAINLAAGKNLAGTFHQPKVVICDTKLLASLDEAEFQSGLGEVVKTALIEGPEALEQLEDEAEALRGRDAGSLQRIVASCVQTKARIVVSDPEERGPRRALNLGHTFGHAIEHAAGYGRIPHGIAVGVGLRLAAAASPAALGASDEGWSERVGALLSSFGLPSDLPELRTRYGLGAELSPAALIEGLGHDKKGRVGAPEFVLMRKPGEIELGVPLTPHRLSKLFA